MSKIRVALIEDDELTQIGLKTALKQRDDIEWVGEAVNGSEGLQLLQRLQPDIAIVDIGLPDINGIELTKQFKQSLSADEEAPTKILILTLRDSEDEVLAAFAAGADSYCMKDTRTELLLEAIKATGEGNSWIDPAIARIVLSQAKKAKIVSQGSQISTTDPLTDRELEVLQLIVDGYSNAEIAQRLFITLGTVKTHVRKILTKLSADDRTQAAVRALRSGLVG
ncbi:MAG: response regulator transcription factor [Hydrococcus sp. C42_A2020_068]|nr:response regulator transcription factor [Hydrococcus sp. C42_A2020_068]